MKPTPAVIERGMPRSASAATPPTRASGTPEKTRSASRIEPSPEYSSTRISSSAAGVTSASRCEADSSCSNVPPYSIQ